jgi:PAS domain S-box-containing protein
MAISQRGDAFSKVAQLVREDLDEALGIGALAARWEELEEEAEELATEGRRYLDFFQFAPEAYLVTDREGTISAANHGARELLGLPVPEGKPLSTFIALDQRAAFRGQLGLLRDARACPSLRWNSAVRDRRGTRIGVNLHVRVMESGTARGYCWLIRALDATR